MSIFSTSAHLAEGTLIAATLTTGLTAGLLFAFTHCVMPGSSPLHPPSATRPRCGGGSRRPG